MVLAGVGVVGLTDGADVEEPLLLPTVLAVVFEKAQWVNFEFAGRLVRRRFAFTYDPTSLSLLLPRTSLPYTARQGDNLQDSGWCDKNCLDDSCKMSTHSTCLN